MRILRTFILSCETFGGFSCTIDVNDYETIQDVINEVLARLMRVLAANNFIALVDKLEKTTNRYHVHDRDIGYVLIEDQEYYVCNHGCHAEEDGKTE
jgi:hypothetical protein